MPTRVLALAALLAAALVAASGVPGGGAAVHGLRAGARHAAPRILRVPILMYHRIDRLTSRLPGITRRLTVTPADFAAQMGWLHAHGYHALREAQLLAALQGRARLPAKPLVITFDDGYRDVLANAAPTLHRLGLPATAFVITGRISGPDTSFLTWPQLHRLERLGVEIGSHTVTHRELTRLPDDAALHELTASRAMLAAQLGHPEPWFAYPAGAEDARVVGLTARAGYALAMTTHSGATQDGAHPLELRRFEVLDTTGVDGLATMLGSAASRR